MKLACTHAARAAFTVRSLSRVSASRMNCSASATVGGADWAVVCGSAVAICAFMRAPEGVSTRTKTGKTINSRTALRMASDLRENIVNGAGMFADALYRLSYSPGASAQPVIRLQQRRRCQGYTRASTRRVLQKRHFALSQKAKNEQQG